MMLEQETLPVVFANAPGPSHTAILQSGEMQTPTHPPHMATALFLFSLGSPHPAGSGVHSWSTQGLLTLCPQDEVSPLFLLCLPWFSDLHPKFAGMLIRNFQMMPSLALPSSIQPRSTGNSPPAPADPAPGNLRQPILPGSSSSPRCPLRLHLLGSAPVPDSASTPRDRAGQATPCAAEVGEHS